MWHDKYTTISLGVHNRLQETHYFYNTAYILFLHYCFEKGCLTEDEVKELHKSYYEMLTGLVQAQQLRVDQDRVTGAKGIDFLLHLISHYRNDGFSIADSTKMYIHDIHDGLIHNGFLCLRSEALIYAFPDHSLDDIVSGLKAQNAIKLGFRKRVRQIYHTGGKWFYFIPLYKLQ
jgi:hypothetical protein